VVREIFRREFLRADGTVFEQGRSYSTGDPLGKERRELLPRPLAGEEVVRPEAGVPPM